MDHVTDYDPYKSYVAASTALTEIQIFNLTDHDNDGTAQRALLADLRAKLDAIEQTLPAKVAPAQ